MSGFRRSSIQFNNYFFSSRKDQFIQDYPLLKGTEQIQPAKTMMFKPVSDHNENAPMAHIEDLEVQESESSSLTSQTSSLAISERIRKKNKRRKDVEDIAESLNKLAQCSEEMVGVVRKVAAEGETTSSLMRRAN